MTTGALIFAFDNEAIDYLSLARWSARNIRRHLGIPVCVVTDRLDAGPDFDQVKFVTRDPSDTQRHFDDVGRPVTWYNRDRVSAFDLTPWDQTLLLDADYVVASDRLSAVLHSEKSFVCHRSSFDVTGCNDFKGLNTFGRYHMPMWWATVIMFRRCDQSQQIFDIMRMVRSNWKHYLDLYAVGRSGYRNDYALSIALNVISGHTLQVDSVPWDLASVMPNQCLLQDDVDRYRVEFRDVDGRARYVQLHDMDFHAMCKAHLGALVADQI